MDLDRVPEENKQAVIDALPNWTVRFTDETLRECVERKDLQGAVNRIQLLSDEGTNLWPAQRVTLLASGDAHFMDCLLSPVILAGISKMLTGNI